MSKDLSVRPYILRFGMVYVIGIIILSVGFIIFDLSHSAYASVIVLIGAVLSATSEFIQDTGRVPNSKEKSKLIWLTFLVTWLIFLILVFAAVLLLGGLQGMTEFGNMLSNIGATKLVGAVSIISLVNLLIMFFGYGKVAELQYNLLRNRGMM